MKRFTILSAVLISSLGLSAQPKSGGYPVNPVPFTSVTITPNTFWGQRLEASREVTVPLAFSKCEETGRYHNFEIAAQQLQGINTETVKVGGFPFDARAQGLHGDVVQGQGRRLATRA